MKRMICIMMATLILICSGCASKVNDNFENEYCAETDFQYTLNSSVNELNFAETPQGIFFTNSSCLYYMTEDEEVHLLCSDPNCNHEYGSSCSARYIFINNFFYYDGALYIVGLNREMYYEISKITLQGELVKTVEELPRSLQWIVLHRGVFYYSYYIEDDSDNEDSIGIATFAEVDINGKNENIIYSNNECFAMLNVLSAYGKYVYVREFMSYDEDFENSMARILIYDIENGAISQIPDTANINICNNKLYLNKMKDDWKTLHIADLDGGNIQESGIKMKYDNGLKAVIGDVIVEDNSIEYTNENIENGTYNQVFRLYKNNELMTEFSIDDINGKKNVEESVNVVVASEKYVIMVITKNQFAILDKTDFEQGQIEPVIINI